MQETKPHLVLYQCNGQLCEGYAVERRPGLLPGNMRVRIVDFITEARDDDAGIWLDESAVVVE